MKLKNPLDITVIMIGGYLNIIWIGIVVLALIFGSYEFNTNLYYSTVATLFFSIFSALMLRYSSSDNKKNTIKIIIILLLINSLIYSIIMFSLVSLKIYYFFILLGPGTIISIFSFLIRKHPRQ